MNDPRPKPLTVVARIQAKPGRETAVAAELHRLLEPSRRDAGCLNYDLHVSLETPGLFLFYENWETPEAWAAHMDTPHLLKWRTAAEDLVQDIELLQMEPVE